LFFTYKLMVLMQYIFLGLVQGVTEPLPISSSGHTILLKNLFDLSTPGLSFEIVLHLGSLIAIIFIYRRDIISILLESFSYIHKRDEAHRHSFIYLIHLLVATAITGVIGIFLEDTISNRLATPITVAIALLVTGLLLLFAQSAHGIKRNEDITMMDAIIIGCAQALALIPGISRSGTTLVAGLLLGFQREAALRFSFLLFIPVSIGMHILSIPRLMTSSSSHHLFIPYLLAFLIATFATYFALIWFKKLVLSGRLAIFSLYCFIVGIAVAMWHLI